LQFFNNYYYKINKKINYIEFKEYSFSEELKETSIARQDYD